LIKKEDLSGDRSKDETQIAILWKDNVYGKKLSRTDCGLVFDGLAGNLLKLAFNLTVNNKNRSDFNFFELKLYGSCVTFGDWKGTFIWETTDLSRAKFLEFFGSYNSKKFTYYWCGRVVPSFFRSISYRGVYWEFCNETLEMCYDSNLDTLSSRVKTPSLRNKRVVLVSWSLSSIKTRYLNKFSGKILLAKRRKGVHDKLLVINNLSWDQWWLGFKEGTIKFDPCLSSKCRRNRSLFRTPVKNLLNLGYTEYSINAGCLKKRVVYNVLK
jgi:hypothetical protein